MLFLLLVLGGIGLTVILADSEFFSDPKKLLSDYIENYIETFGEDSDEKEIKIKLANKTWKHWFLKKILYLCYCYQCIGAQVGLILGAIVHPLPEYFSGWDRITEAVLCAGAISFLTTMGMALFNYLNIEYGEK